MGSAATTGRPSRHRTGRSSLGHGIVFAKAARRPDDRGDLAHEATVYGLLHGGNCPHTERCTPRGVRWDPKTGELAMEALDAPDLAQAVADTGRLDVDAAEALGRVVARLHVEGGLLDADAPSSAWTVGGIDWHRPGPAHLRVLSGGGIELLEMLQRSERLWAHLARVARPSDADTLVHGDLRWENVLVAEEPDPPRIWLVDWEFAGIGESAWDVGCFAAACVSGWLSSIPHVPGVPPARLLDEAALPMDAIRPGLAAFWTGYGEISRPGLDGWRDRCIELTATRLVHLAFEATTGDEQLRACPVAHLQVALHMLDGPTRAAEELLGLPW